MPDIPENHADAREIRFAWLMNEHGPALARLAAAYEPDPRDREDLMQDIAFAIWRALPAFRGESSERTFVFRIGHNRAITHRSRSLAHGRRMASNDLLEVPDTAADPASVVIASEQRSALMHAIRTLSPMLRETMVLSLEGMSHDEIAEVLGTSVRNVAVRLVRGRAALISLLRRDESEPNSAGKVHR